MPRILSLDGGGSWALIQVRALMKLYGDKATGYDVLRDFDLVAANSGGSIVAGALACGWPLQQASDFFHDEAARKTIFVEKPFFDRLPEEIIDLGPKYGTGDKFIGLTKLFGATGKMKMDALPEMLADPAKVGHRVDFIIPTFDYDRCRGILFRSDTASLAASRTPVPVTTLTGAIHASSTAPVNFFDEPATFPGKPFKPYRFWDGGVAGLNNPMLAAVMELLANGEDRAKIQVRSIGTGSVRLPVGLGDDGPPLFQTMEDSGLVADLKKLAASIVDDPPDEASLNAYIALGLPMPAAGATAPVGGNRLVRLNPMIQPVRDAAGAFAVPDIVVEGQSPEEAFTALANLDMDAVEDGDIELIDALVDAWVGDAVANQPVRTNLNLECEIGHPTFSAATAVW